MVHSINSGSGRNISLLETEEIAEVFAHDRMLEPEMNINYKNKNQ